MAVQIHSQNGEAVAPLAVAGPKDRLGGVAVERFIVVPRAAAAEMHDRPLLAFADHSRPATAGPSSERPDELVGLGVTEPSLVD